MIEKQISIEGIDPTILYGVHNKHLNKISTVFTQVKIITRGHDLKVIGEETRILEFEKKIHEIIDFVRNHNELTEEDLSLLLEDNSKELLVDINGKNEVLVYGNNGKPIKARTINQKILVHDSIENDIVLAVGPAGTGKTYTTIALAVRALKNREVRKIILTRPAVEAGEHLGFLPGDVREKLDPYLQPLYDALRDMISPKKLEDYIEDQTIQIAPIAFMRGRTLENAFVVMDEAQNATSNQMKMFLTRMGVNSKFIITGDITQIDLPRKSDSGLVLAMRVLEGIDGISIIMFDERDIVRHKLVKDIVRAYESIEKPSENNENNHPDNAEGQGD